MCDQEPKPQALDPVLILHPLPLQLWKRYIDNVVDARRTLFQMLTDMALQDRANGRESRLPVESVVGRGLLPRREYLLLEAEVLKASWNEGEEADKAEASLCDWINSQILDPSPTFVHLCVCVADYVMSELRCAEARAHAPQELIVHAEPRALQAHALVQAHAQRQQNVFELQMREHCEISVVLKREIVDQERGDEARTQRVDAEGHGAREGVSHFSLHDLDQTQHSSAS